MGLILDSSILIASERKGLNARQCLSALAERAEGEEIALSVITVLELVHGVSRAETVERQAIRRQFLAEILGAVPVHPVSLSIALRAGQIDAANSARGVRVALADLLIGVTALDLDYGIVTANSRHFRLIPGLKVISL